MWDVVGQKGLPCTQFGAQVYTIKLHGQGVWEEAGRGGISRLRVAGVPSSEAAVSADSQAFPRLPQQIFPARSSSSATPRLMKAWTRLQQWNAVLVLTRSQQPGLLRRLISCATTKKKLRSPGSLASKHQDLGFGLWL